MNISIRKVIRYNGMIWLPFTSRESQKVRTGIRMYGRNINLINGTIRLPFISQE